MVGTPLRRDSNQAGPTKSSLLNHKVVIHDASDGGPIAREKDMRRQPRVRALRL